MSTKIIHQSIEIRIPKEFKALNTCELYLVSRLVARFDNKSLEDLSVELSSEIRRRYSNYIGDNKHKIVRETTELALKCLPWLHNEIAVFEDVFKENERLGRRVSKTLYGKHPGDIKNMKRKLTINFIEKGE